jgi:uncharacterized protein YaeQ
VPLDEIRYHFRVTVADLSRGVQGDGTLVPLHPREEPLERFFLRLLAWAWWWTPELRIASHHDPDEPSLYADDPSGRKSVWVAVDPADAEFLGHAVRHNRGAVIGACFSDRDALDRFLATTRGVKGLDAVEFITVDTELLHAMAAALDERRYDVAITIVEDHLYLQAGRRSFDGLFVRRRGPPPAAELSSPER